MVARHAQSQYGYAAGPANDGTNEAEVQQWFRSKFGTFMTPDAVNYVAGVLSEAENRTISAGVNDVVMDYLVDAVDRNGETELVFRSGSTKTIQPGSWIVNCTGYLRIDKNPHPYEPYVSASGAVLSIQPRSATLHLSSFQGYFLTHLMFLDKLTSVPLYELDLQELREKSALGFTYALFRARPAQFQPHLRQRPSPRIQRERT